MPPVLETFATYVALGLAMLAAAISAPGGPGSIPTAFQVLLLTEATPDIVQASGAIDEIRRSS